MVLNSTTIDSLVDYLHSTGISQAGRQNSLGPWDFRQLIPARVRLRILR